MFLLSEGRIASLWWDYQNYFFCVVCFVSLVSLYFCVVIVLMCVYIYIYLQNILHGSYNHLFPLYSIDLFLSYDIVGTKAAWQIYFKNVLHRDLWTS